MKLRGNKDLKVFDKLFGSDQGFAANHNIIKADIFFNRRCPEWAKHDGQVRQLLLRVFPKLETDAKHRERAGRWMRIITLYFREGHSDSYTADVMSISTKTVKDTVYRIKRRASGLSSDNHHKLTNRPPGRPRKSYASI